jgi:hypothetical protein
VLAAQVRGGGAVRQVAVLDQFGGLGDAAGAQVDRHHRLDLGQLGPAHELVEPEGVALQRPPGQVQAPRAVTDRADPVLPAVVGDEVAARVAHQRDTELADQLEHVGAQPVGVRRRVAGLEDAGVDAATHVFDERAEEPPVDRTDGEGGVEGQPSLVHVALLSAGSVVRLTLFTTLEPTL